MKERNLLFGDENLNNKPLINDILKFEFSREEKQEYTPFASKNRKINKLKNNKIKIKGLNKDDSRNKYKFKSRPKSAAYILTKKTNYENFENKFIEEDLAGDNLNVPVEDGSFEEIYQNKNEIKHKESETEKQNFISSNSENKNLFYSDKIVDTVNLISKNPEKFKNTNKLLKNLGQFTKNIMHIVMDSEKDKIMMEKAIKDLEIAEDNKKRANENSKKIDQTIKQNEHELSNIRNQALNNQSKKKTAEEKSRLQHMINTLKEESKVNKSFDINNLNKKEREFLTSKLNYVYKQRGEVNDLVNETKLNVSKLNLY